MTIIPIWASQINNLSVARYMAAWNVAWVGYCFDPSQANAIDIITAKEISGWIEGGRRMGEFGNQNTANDITKTVIEAKLHAVCVPYDYPQTISDIPIFYKIIITPYTTEAEIRAKMTHLKAQARGFLLDFATHAISWQSILMHQFLSLELLKRLSNDFPIWMQINITGKEAVVLVNKIPIQGLTVIGGEEEKVGLMSFDELDDLMEDLAS